MSESNTKQMIQLNHVKFGYSDTEVLEEINLTIHEGEYVVLTGENGSGKSTLLNCISTIDRVTSGNIKVNGEEITKLKGNKLNKFRREELGFIFQDFNLLDTLSCYEI